MPLSARINCRSLGPCNAFPFDGLDVLSHSGQAAGGMDGFRQHVAHFVGGEAQHPTEGGIGANNAFPLGVDDGDAVDDLVVDGLQFAMALAKGVVGLRQFRGSLFHPLFQFVVGLLQGGFAALAVGDIAGNAHDGGHRRTSPAAVSAEC